MPCRNQVRFTYSFSRHILSTYYVRGTVLGLGIQKPAKQTKFSALKGLTSGTTPDKKEGWSLERVALPLCAYVTYSSVFKYCDMVCGLVPWRRPLCLSVCLKEIQVGPWRETGNTRIFPAPMRRAGASCHSERRGRDPRPTSLECPAARRWGQHYSPHGEDVF